MKNLYYKLNKQVHGPYGTWIFALLVFIEGFFIVPISTILTLYCLERREKSFMYAAIATAVSALAAATGYFLGFGLWKSIGQDVIYYIVSPATFNYLVDQFRCYQDATVFIVAATPLPFKALTLTAGFCKLPLLPFILFVMLGRAVKFYLISGAVYIYGDKVKYLIDNYFYYILAAGLALFVATWWLLH